MLQALDVISVQALTHRGRDRVRRCREIVELAGIDPLTGNLLVNTVYEYNPVPDTFSYSGRSRILSEIMEYRGWSRTRLDEELRIRRTVLVAMGEQGIRDYRAVARIIQAFTIDRDRVLASLDDLGGLIR
jgi:flagellar protein FlaI